MALTRLLPRPHTRAKTFERKAGERCYRECSGHGVAPSFANGQNTSNAVQQVA